MLWPEQYPSEVLCGLNASIKIIQWAQWAMDIRQCISSSPKTFLQIVYCWSFGRMIKSRQIPHCLLFPWTQLSNSVWKSWVSFWCSFLEQKKSTNLINSVLGASLLNSLCKYTEILWHQKGKYTKIEESSKYRKAVIMNGRPKDCESSLWSEETFRNSSKWELQFFPPTNNIPPFIFRLLGSLTPEMAITLCAINNMILPCSKIHCKAWNDFSMHLE